MKKFKVRVEISGKVIFFRDRKIRTPFEIELTDKDLELFKFAMNSSGISDYTFEEIKEGDESTWEDIIVPNDKEVVIEDLYVVEESQEATTILGKLLQDEKNGE